jgi:hypothetical protein
MQPHRQPPLSLSAPRVSAIPPISFPRMSPTSAVGATGAIPARLMMTACDRPPLATYPRCATLGPPLELGDHSCAGPDCRCHRVATADGVPRP